MRKLIRDIRLRELYPDEFDYAVDLAARAMRDQPIHIKVFGEDPDRRKEKVKLLYSIILKRVMSKGMLLCAENESAMVGILGILPPNACQAGLLERLKIIPKIISGYDFRTIWLVRRWIRQWRKLEPKEPHVHLGPIAIEPNLEGIGIMGVGHSMMTAVYPRLDEYSEISYVETDRREIAELFRKKYQGEIIRKVDVLGVPTWSLKRKPRGADRGQT